MWRADDLRFVLTLPKAWLRESLRPGAPERLTTTLSLLRVETVLRLLPDPEPTDTFSADLSVRHLPTGAADRGQGRLRLAGSTAETVEAVRALDGSYQVQRSGLRGNLSLPPNTAAAIYETSLWFVLGKLFQLGKSGEQRFLLIREGAQPGLVTGLLSLRENGEDKLGRRLSYTAAPSLGFPAERRKGTLWIGPEGELLQSELWPEQKATGPLAPAGDNDPAYVLKRTDGTMLRAEQREKGWLLTEKAPNKPESPYELELDFERRLKRLTSQRAGTLLSLEWDGTVLRYAYPTIPPRFWPVPPEGIALFLTALLLPEPVPGLKVGQKRPVLLLPLLTGDDNGLMGELEHLPNDPRKQAHYRLALDGGTVLDLTHDTLGLVRLTSNNGLTIVRK